MPGSIELIHNLYAWFNARNVDMILTALHSEVQWANGMEGGYVHGRDGVRQYWKRQWEMIDPRVDPVNITVQEADRIEVEVHQVVRDLEGNPIQDKVVHHQFQIDDGLIKRFDIR